MILLYYSIQVNITSFLTFMIYSDFALLQFSSSRRNWILANWFFRYFWYSKLWILSDQIFQVWNIKVLHHQVAYCIDIARDLKIWVCGKKGQSSQRSVLYNLSVCAECSFEVRRCRFNFCYTIRILNLGVLFVISNSQICQRIDDMKNIYIYFLLKLSN